MLQYYLDSANKVGAVCIKLWQWFSSGLLKKDLTPEEFTSGQTVKVP